LTASHREPDRVIEAALGNMARAMGAERATLWQRHGDSDEFTKSHRWLAEGVAAPPDSTAGVALPWIYTQLAAGAVVRFDDYTELPPEAAADMDALRSLDVQAAVIVPLKVSEAVVGALSFANSREAKDWPEGLVPRVQLLGEVFAAVLARRAAERREQEAMAQAAHAARVGTMGVVVASLVHELTQPITAGLANAETAVELVAASSPDIDELRATAADILADARRAGDLIQQLRRFLRRGEAERVEFEFRTLLNDVLRLARSKSNEMNIDLELDVPDALPSIEGDRIQLQQVLLNLLLNAFDAVALNERGARRVVVRARQSGAGVVVEVIDSGRGMDEPTLEHIFEPFFTTKSRGMGLGLSISRTIVAAHGGTLAAQSAPGRGTAVRFELPLKPPGQIRPSPQVQPQATESATVYVIDDDPSMRRAVERHLEGTYRVETFSSARAFLELEPQGVACIVSDVGMPGLNGLELQETLARADRQLPIVFISGLNDVPITAQAMKAGAVNFLAKPFSRSDLLASVAEALARSRETDAARRERATLESLQASLTPREREVFALVAAGLLNKVIADRLGTAEATVKIHRGRVMGKLGAASVADLVRMAERLGVTPASASLLG
jgi:FixJ family two-component response regulator/signal transduction histidine kinase